MLILIYVTTRTNLVREKSSTLCLPCKCEYFSSSSKILTERHFWELILEFIQFGLKKDLRLDNLPIPNPRLGSETHFELSSTNRFEIQIYCQP